MNPVSSRHRVVALLGVSGSAVGVVAGAIQATIGSRIPEWSGAKAAPIALGLLTIGLAVVAGWSAVEQRTLRSARGRAACALGMVGPGLLCLSTVGRLWYVPGVLLVVAGSMTIDSWQETVRVLSRDWLRVLLSALGGFEILMAAGASPLLMVVGIVGGLALIVAAWWRSLPRRSAVALVAVGTVPFAAIAWTAVVPVLLAVVAVAIAIPMLQQPIPLPAVPPGPAVGRTASGATTPSGSAR